MPNPVFFLAALAVLATTPAWAAPQAFQAELDPAPFDASTHANVVGIGNITATLDGGTLTFTGTFSGLSSPATGSHLLMGAAEGVTPGTVIGDLIADHGASGALSGTIKLNAKQLAGLRASTLYVRLDSEKAPDGNLQGWLEAAGN
jgi:hypothetical protein